MFRALFTSGSGRPTNPMDTVSRFGPSTGLLPKTLMSINQLTKTTRRSRCCKPRHTKESTRTASSTDKGHLLFLMVQVTRENSVKTASQGLENMSTTQQVKIITTASTTLGNSRTGSFMARVGLRGRLGTGFGYCTKEASTMGKGMDMEVWTIRKRCIAARGRMG